ncbi:hypothetical protein [Agreia bicolorata]|uniref:hypothetical protein n=1 Tax=Agreia bicolorata TaxID=110935 RepID=UPI001116EE43|nr:hypothetical protein [Agreia bicolorata]
MIRKTTSKFGHSEDQVMHLGTLLDHEIARSYPPAALYRGVVREYVAEEAIVLSSDEGNGEIHASQLSKVIDAASGRAEKQLRESLPQIAVRLHAADRNLWNEYDRLSGRERVSALHRRPAWHSCFRGRWAGK